MDAETAPEASRQEPESLLLAVYALGCSAQAAWSLGLCSKPSPQRAYMEQEAAVGDLVLELTTFHHRFRSPTERCLDSVGIIEAITREPFGQGQYTNPDGSPVMEDVWYLNTLDGRVARWTNASFIRIPARTFLHGAD